MLEPEQDVIPEVEEVNNDIHRFNHDKDQKLFNDEKSRDEAEH
jgi:hypothetical protein